MSIFKRKKGEEEADTALSSPGADAGAADESAWALPADAGAIGGDTAEQDRVRPATAAGGAGDDRGATTGADSPTQAGLSGAVLAAPGAGLDADPAAVAATQTAAATPEEEYPEPAGTATVHTTPKASTPDSEGGERHAEIARDAPGTAAASSTTGIAGTTGTAGTTGAHGSASAGSSAAATAQQRPELVVAGAFAGAFIVARILRRITE